MTTSLDDLVAKVAAEPSASRVDRSSHTYAVVMKGIEAGLDDDSIKAVAADDPGSVEKYGIRLDEEVDRIIDKERPAHDHVGRSCAAAGCTGRAAAPDVAPRAHPEIREVDWSKFWGTPPAPPAYILEPVLPEGRIVTLFSPPKIGKSLLGLEIGAGAATGARMWDQQLPTYDVLYVDQEMNPEDLRLRLEDLGYTADTDLSRLHYCQHEPWLSLDTPAGGALLLAHVQRTGSRLVILDTQSKLVDGEENDSGTMTRFFKFTLGPLKKLGVTVLLLDHAGRDVKKGARGSSQKPADVDAVWLLSTRSKTGLTLKRTHNRTGHGEDVVFLERMTQPLKHIRQDVDDRLEDLIETCMDHIRDLDVSADTSTREVGKLLRARKFKYKDETIRDAHKRVRAEDG